MILGGVGGNDTVMEGMAMTCPGCAQSNPAGNRFCGDCGAPLPLPCPSCGSAVPANKRYCGDCGSPLTGGVPAGTSDGDLAADVTGFSALSPSAATVPECASTSSVPATASRAYIAAADKERRLVTILFADLVGSTALGEMLDPEAVDAVVSVVQAALAKTVAQYGGHVVKYLGDGLMALFGAPTAHEDDAAHAILAGLQMHRALASVNETRPHGFPQLQMRIGISSGEVVAGATALGYDVIGDAANTAARLQSAADVGGVLVDTATMQLAQRHARFGERRELSLKGKAGKVTAFPALESRERAAERWEMHEQRTPLVGREHEVALLMDAWACTLHGNGRMVTLVAEAGGGKSRLLAEALAHMTASGDTRVIHGRCPSYGQQMSLWLIADLLRDLCAIHASDSPEHARASLARGLARLLAGEDAESQAATLDVLGTILGLPPGLSFISSADPRTRRHVVIRGMRRLLAALATHVPTVLILEDIHWADIASIQVLTEILPDIQGLRLLVIATQRPEWEAPWSGWGWPRLIPLLPLGEQHAAVLAQAVLGGAALTPDLARHVIERAGGNPFFIEELLRGLWEAGDLSEHDGQMRLVPGAVERLPSTVVEMLLARLDRLERQARSLAQVASVIGRRFMVQLLAHITEYEAHTLQPSLAALQEAEIVSRQPYAHTDSEPEYAFKHATLRETAYNTLLLRRRQELHAATARAVAHLYSGQELVDVIAYHWAQTAEHAEAASWLERAGDRATSVYANTAAINHYSAARERLELCRAQDGELARLDEKLGDVRLLIGEYAQAHDDFARARSLQPDRGRRVDLWRKQGLTWEKRAEHEQALATYAEAEAEGRGQRDNQTEPLVPVEAWAALEIRRAEVYYYQGDYEQAKAAAEQVLTLLCDGPGARGTSPESARAHTCLGSVAFRRGDYARAEECYRRGLASWESIGDQQGLANSWNNLGNIAYIRGAHASADECYQRSLTIRERIGDQWAIAGSWSNLGLVALDRGNYTHAEECYRRSLEIRERIGDQQGLADSWHNLGEMAYYLGNYAGAETCLEHSRDIRERIGDKLGLADSWDCLGGVARARGDLARAETYYRRSLAICERIGDQRGVANAWAGLGEVAGDRGDVAIAASLCRRARLLASSTGVAETETRAALGQAHARIRARRLRVAGALLEHGRKLAAKHGSVRVAMQAELLWAELLLEQGRVPRALTIAEQVLQQAASRQLRPEQARTLRLIGQCNLASGNASEAVTALRASLEILADMGAKLEVASTKLVLTEALAAAWAAEQALSMDQAHAIGALVYPLSAEPYDGRHCDD